MSAEQKNYKIDASAPGKAFLTADSLRSTRRMRKSRFRTGGNKTALHPADTTKALARIELKKFSKAKIVEKYRQQRLKICQIEQKYLGCLEQPMNFPYIAKNV